MKKVSGRFIADGAAINVNIGFIPDYVKLIGGLDNTNPVIYEFFKDLSGENGQYGIQIAGSHTGDDNGTEAIITKLAGTNALIKVYEGGKKVKVKIPAPDGNGFANAEVSDFVAGAAQPTARSTTAVGTVVRPSTHNGFVYECTASAGVLGTEPVWPTTPGESVSDGTNTWICRREDVVFEKAAGFTIGADLSTDGDEWVYVAEQHDKVVNHGDAAAADPI
jgi:hypothetical protein